MLKNSLLKLLCVVLSPLFVSISGCESDLSTVRGEKEAQATRVFLQQISFDSAIVKWRGGPDVLWYGIKPNGLSQNVTANVEAGHKISKLEGLSADTVYYYAFQEVGPEADIMSFRTAPASGAVPADGNTHIWLLGDSGTATENQKK